MAGDDPVEDKDALDALELEAKEFDKVGRVRGPLLPSCRADPTSGRRDRQNPQGFSARCVSPLFLIYRPAKG
jgi:hypothetical protein